MKLKDVFQALAMSTAIACVCVFAFGIGSKTQTEVEVKSGLSLADMIGQEKEQAEIIYKQRALAAMATLRVEREKVRRSKPVRARKPGEVR